jgi:prepilin-type N-terminal cleavage/methylation domain-containing protein
MLKKYKIMKSWKKVYRHGFIEPMRESLGSSNPRILQPCSKGFTLIEIIIVIVILSAVSVISVKFLVDSMRIYTMTVNQKTLFDEGKLALERMCRDIRDAKSITTFTAGPPGSITFVRTNATYFDQGLPGNATGETIIFQQNAVAGTLEKVKSLPSASTTTMAEHVTSFTVANATNEIQLQLTLSLTSGENVTLQTKVYPKNLPVDGTATYKNFCRKWKEAISS